MTKEEMLRKVFNDYEMDNINMYVITREVPYAVIKKLYSALMYYKTHNHARYLSFKHRLLNEEGFAYFVVKYRENEKKRRGKRGG